MINKKILSGIALGTVLSLALAVPAFAQTNVNTNVSLWGRIRSKISMTLHGRGSMMRPVVTGTVTAVSGNTLTVSGRSKGERDENSSAVTFTVDASSATIMKANATTTVSGISVGDVVMISGTVNGTNVTATTIRVGGQKGQEQEQGQNQNPLQGISGNGAPVIAGTIASINGNSFTLTNSGSVTYTIDATNAKITVLGMSTAAISNLKVGDHVVVQGAVNGSAISATTVIDQTATAQKPEGGFGGIGTFIKHLFGF